MWPPHADSFKTDWNRYFKLENNWIGFNATLGLKISYVRCLLFLSLSPWGPAGAGVYESPPQVIILSLRQFGGF